MTSTRPPIVAPEAPGRAGISLSCGLWLAAMLVAAAGCAPTHQGSGPQRPAAPLSKRPPAATVAKPQKNHSAAQPQTKTQKNEGPEIPVVALAQTPPDVRAAIVAEAHGRPLEKITRIVEIKGPVFRAYISDPAGPQLLTLDAQGEVIDNAVVVRFEDLPKAVQDASKTAVGGKLGVCRKSIHRPKLTYVLDYLLGTDEPTFLLIEADGFVRGLYGYAEEDPD